MQRARILGDDGKRAYGGADAVALLIAAIRVEEKSLQFDMQARALRCLTLGVPIQHDGDAEPTRERLARALVSRGLPSVKAVCLERRAGDEKRHGCRIVERHGQRLPRSLVSRKHYAGRATMRRRPLL